MKARLAAFSLLGAIAVIAVNVICASYLNFYYWEGTSFSRWEGFVAHIVELHGAVVGPFLHRPVTTFLARHTAVALGPWWGFVLVQLALLALSAWAVGRVAGKVGEGRGELGAALAYLFSFSVLFSFVTPNDAYDEPAQYLFLFLCLSALLAGRNALFGLCFFLACLARETSLLLLPGFLWLAWKERRDHLARIGVSLALALGFYAAARASLPGEEDPQRWLYWRRNFADLKAAAESVLSLALAWAVPFLAWALARGKWKARGVRATLLQCFATCAALNTPLVLAAAYARETRLFALPLVFLWPLAGIWLSGWWERVSAGKLAFRFHVALLFPLTGAAALAICYQPSYRNTVVYRASAVLLALLFSLPLAFTGRSSRGSSSR